MIGSRGLIDLGPLRASPDFRRCWAGTTLSSFGGRLTLVAVLYQAWELTGSTVTLGLIALVEGASVLVAGLVGGSLADRVDRRALVLASTSGQMATVALLAVLTSLGATALGPLVALVAVKAGFGALGAPARRTFAARLLPREHVSAGIALTHVGFQAAMLVGPAVGGVIVAARGVGVCYTLDALTFGGALYAVLRLPSMRPSASREDRGNGRLSAGFRVIGSTSALRGAFLTDLLATVMAMPVSLFPALNAQRFGDDPRNLGLLLSALAVGGVAAGAASGMVTRSPRPGRVMLVAAATWALGIVGLGVAPQLWLALAALALAGAADTLSVISRATVVQLATPDALRGRVSAVEHVVGVAGPEVGNFRGGLVAGVTSGPFAVVAGGVLCLLGVAAVAVTHPSLRRYEVRDEAVPSALST